MYGCVVIGKTLLTKLCFAGYSFDYPITFSLFSCLTTMVACAVVFATGNPKLLGACKRTAQLGSTLTTE